jgi:hypothetical protein
METISHFVGDYEGMFLSPFSSPPHLRPPSDDRNILDRVVDLKGGPSTTAQLNEYVKTAEDFSSPIRPYSSPTPGDRSANFSPSGRAKYIHCLPSFPPSSHHLQDPQDTYWSLREDWSESWSSIFEII